MLSALGFGMGQKSRWSSKASEAKGTTKRLGVHYKKARCPAVRPASLPG